MAHQATSGGRSDLPHELPTFNDDLSSFRARKKSSISAVNGEFIPNMQRAWQSHEPLDAEDFDLMLKGNHTRDWVKAPMLELIAATQMRHMQYWRVPRMSLIYGLHAFDRFIIRQYFQRAMVQFPRYCDAIVNKIAAEERLMMQCYHRNKSQSHILLDNFGFTKTTTVRNTITACQTACQALQKAPHHSLSTTAHLNLETFAFSLSRVKQDLEKKLDHYIYSQELIAAVGEMINPEMQLTQQVLQELYFAIETISKVVTGEYHMVGRHRPLMEVGQVQALPFVVDQRRISGVTLPPLRRSHTSVDALDPPLNL